MFSVVWLLTSLLRGFVGFIRLGFVQVDEFVLLLRMLNWVNIDCHVDPSDYF